MASPTTQHRETSPENLGCAVLTVSDSRTLQTDTGGAKVIEYLQQAGHRVVDRQIVPDEPPRVREWLRRWNERPEVDAVLVTGGTGISHRDQTPETIAALLTKPLPGYGELFRMLSYAQVGPAAMLSRTVGGLMERTVVLTMPGSPKAVELAMEKLIVPELPHLVREARR